MKIFFIRLERSKSLAKFPLYRFVHRSGRRKLARIIYRFVGVIKGFSFGAISVLLLWGAFMMSAHAQSTNPQCGGTSQPRCDVYAPVDTDTTTASQNAQTAITTNITSLKGAVTNIPDNSFSWTFIPQIPTTACSNPQLIDPMGASMVTMDICTPFNTFQSFINGVLAFFCVIGCVRQFETALKA